METRRSGDAAAASGGAAAPAADVAHGCLCTFFAQESATLLPSLRRYVLHAGLSSGRSLEDEVADLLQEVVVHALRAAGEFDVTQESDEQHAARERARLDSQQRASWRKRSQQ